MNRLLLVEDDNSLRNTITMFLELEGYAVDAVASTRDALTKLNAGSYHLVVSDIYVDERTGLDVLEAARRANPKCAVILMTGRGTIETVMKATSGGAFEYIAKPFELEQLLGIIKRAQAQLSGSEEKDIEFEELPPTELIGSSAPMIDIYKTVSRVAAKDATVLIEGETGTGKELLARMIHRNSTRAAEPFIAVDCGAIAESLMESELFGAMRGAFTGADRDRIGVFEAANRGSVFLDEIGDTDEAFQLKLLRFLQEREIRPVGSARSKPVDVRVIAATNKNLPKMVEDGEFREDLWFRLNVVRIQIPPLRERHGDIPLLAQSFVQRSNERFSQRATLTQSGLRALEECTWPGNVRQMQHLIERLVILSPNGKIDGEGVRQALQLSTTQEHASDSLADTEADQIKKVLAAANGNKSRAAKILGIERKTLYRKLERMGL